MYFGTILVKLNTRSDDLAIGSCEFYFPTDLILSLLQHFDQMVLLYG